MLLDVRGWKTGCDREKSQGKWSYPIPEVAKRMTLIELFIKMSKIASATTCTFQTAGIQNRCIFQAETHMPPIVNWSEDATCARWRMSNKCRIPSIWPWGGGHDDLRTYQLCDKIGISEGVLVAKTSDTDILFIVVCMLSALWETGLQQLWIAYDQSQHWRWIPVHELCVPIALSHRRAGAFTPSPIAGFDVVFTFCGKGKKMWCMWWDNWCLPHN